MVRDVLRDGGSKSAASHPAHTHHTTPHPATCHAMLHKEDAAAASSPGGMPPTNFTLMFYTFSLFVWPSLMIISYWLSKTLMLLPLLFY